jgi:asparagine synthase (glutamine-hydrolysing)
MPWELPDILPAEMLRDGWGELDPLIRMSASRSGFDDDAVGVAALEMNWYMRNQLLRDSDWAGMAHSLEIRVPFVDIETLKKIAPYLYGDSPIRKSLVAQACGVNLEGRPKTGFTTPVRKWFAEELGSRTSQGLREWARFTMAEAYGGRFQVGTP